MLSYHRYIISVLMAWIRTRAHLIQLRLPFSYFFSAYKNCLLIDILNEANECCVNIEIVKLVPFRVVKFWIEKQKVDNQIISFCILSTLLVAANENIKHLDWMREIIVHEVLEPLSSGDGSILEIKSTNPCPIK